MNYRIHIMGLRYKIKKKWFGFWQKYKLGTQLRIASKLFMLFLGIWIVGSILTILSQWAFTDNFAGTPFQMKYLKYFWPVIIELVSGYDIADIPLNQVSDVLAIVVVITGLVIFAIFTGQIVSMFIHMLQRMNHLPEKPENFIFKRPILICGMSNKFHSIIVELRKSSLSKDREIILISPNSDEYSFGSKNLRTLYRDVWHIKGDQADRSVLANALGEKETSAIILACNAQEGTPHAPAPCGRYADARAIESAMAIEGYQEEAHTVLELLDERNIPHLKHTKINEWISISEFGIKLAAQSTMQHGMGRVFHSLLGGGEQNGESSQFHFSHLPETMDGLTYQQIRDKVLHDSALDITVIGFARRVPLDVIDAIDVDQGNSPYFKQVNPVSRKCRSCATTINETDQLGRVQQKCKACFDTEKEKNRDASNPWHFPKDTDLTAQDKLIYLSRGPVDIKKAGTK